jgi:hypothetical protein
MRGWEVNERRALLCGVWESEKRKKTLLTSARRRTGAQARRAGERDRTRRGVLLASTSQPASEALPSRVGEGSVDRLAAHSEEKSTRSDGEEGKKGSRFSGKEAMRQRGSSVKGVRERPTATARQQQLGE